MIWITRGLIGSGGFSGLSSQGALLLANKVEVGQARKPTVKCQCM